MPIVLWTSIRLEVLRADLQQSPEKDRTVCARRSLLAPCLLQSCQSIICLGWTSCTLSGPCSLPLLFRCRESFQVDFPSCLAPRALSRRSDSKRWSLGWAGFHSGELGAAAKENAEAGSASESSRALPRPSASALSGRSASRWQKGTRPRFSDFKYGAQWRQKRLGPCRNRTGLAWIKTRSTSRYTKGPDLFRPSRQKTVPI